MRHGVWKETFEHFLPLGINEHHGNRAQPHLEECIGRIASRGRQGRSAFTPEHALKVLSAAMNSMVVSIMSSSGSASGATGLHASEAALKGYSYLHHMLLFLASKHPKMASLANDRVIRFTLCVRVRGATTVFR